MNSLKPDKLYFKKHIYSSIIVTFIVFLFFVPFCLFVLGEEDNGSLVLMICSIGWFLLIIAILVYYKFFIDRLSYEIKDNSITIYSGIFTKIEQNIPHSKVTDFVLYRDILDRFWGMGSIKVQTAGASGETGYEGVLSGLLNYESIHKDLRAKLINSQQINTNISSDINNENNDNVLLDILNELKDINNKIDQN